MIYEPREDSLLLQKAVKKLALGKSVMDIGTGSGIQAQTAKRFGALSVLASDIDRDSIRHLLALGIQTVESNLFEKIPKNKKYDLIIFNPPYLPENLVEDPESRKVTTGGKEGDEIILRFLKQAPGYLSPKGIILMVISSLTPHRRIDSLLGRLRLSKKILAEDKHFMETLEVWEIKK